MNPEVFLASAYAVALVLSAFLLEWLAAHTHRRSLRYRTAGFEYRAEHDLWVCPEEQTLWPTEFDSELRLVRYRAKPQICNACPRKSNCTDSDHGREVVRPLDPWPQSESGRFHRTIALLMVGLGGGILAIEATRHHEPGELALLACLLAAAALSARWLLRDLRRHPANFPSPTPAQGIGFATTPTNGNSQTSHRADLISDEVERAPSA